MSAALVSSLVRDLLVSSCLQMQVGRMSVQL